MREYRVLEQVDARPLACCDRRRRGDGLDAGASRVAPPPPLKHHREPLRQCTKCASRIPLPSTSPAICSAWPDSAAPARTSAHLLPAPTPPPPPATWRLARRASSSRLEDEPGGSALVPRHTCPYHDAARRDCGRRALRRTRTRRKSARGRRRRLVVVRRRRRRSGSRPPPRTRPSRAKTQSCTAPGAAAAAAAAARRAPTAASRHQQLGRRHRPSPPPPPTPTPPRPCAERSQRCSRPRAAGRSSGPRSRTAPTPSFSACRRASTRARAPPTLRPRICPR